MGEKWGGPQHAGFVTSLSEKPHDCEVTISLSEDIKRDIMKPGAEGLYRADGSYYRQPRVSVQVTPGPREMRGWGGHIGDTGVLDIILALLVVKP